MKNISLFLSSIIVIIFLLLGTVPVIANSSGLNDKSEEELRQFANENNIWVVCYRQGKRTTRFFQCDATSEYMYFSYSKESCVDVYDLYGKYLYSFIFPDRQDGGVCVRCEENQVYISTKDNVLYVFKGIEEVDRMDYDEAVVNGYDFFWFYNNNPKITVNDDLIRWHSNSGEVVKEISTPDVIKQTIPDDGIRSITKFFTLAVIVVFVAVVRSLINKFKG